VNALPAVPTTPVAARRRGARRLAIVATAIVAVSLLRPWGDGSTPARNAVEPDATSVAVRPPAGNPARYGGQEAPRSATPAPSLATDEIACTPAGWRLVSLDHLGPWTVRSWTPATAVLAAGPLDPAILPITLASPGVLAIGACSPAVFDAVGRLVSGGPARIVRAWRIERGRATVVVLDTRRDEASPGIATLYRPGGTAATDPWPMGEFVIEVAATGATEVPDSRPTLDTPPSPDRGTPRDWFIGLTVRGSG
jgi:hypothetical protein